MDQLHEPTQIKVRNYLGFWLLGLSNNFAYVVMLSAAFDILDTDFHEGNSEQNTSSNKTDEFCNPISTGAVLIADIVPGLLVKFIIPFVYITVNTKVLIVVILTALSFIITAFANSSVLSYIGIACASLCSSLGEVSFLSYTTYFTINVVSLWSSGTGAAGLLGSISYASLIGLGFSPRVTLLAMLIIPVIMAMAFWVIIVPTKTESQISIDSDEEKITLKEKIPVMIPLLRYMIPLSFVYFLVYFINQGLYELIYFEESVLTHKDHYRWFQVDYQLGVLISRSSVDLMHIQQTWIFPIFEAIITTIIYIQVVHPYLPSIWIMFILILLEGLCGGWAYVNTYFQIAHTAKKKFTSFSMAFCSMSDAIGITLAGIIAIPVHNALCKTYFRK